MILYINKDVRYIYIERERLIKAIYIYIHKRCCNSYILVSPPSKCFYESLIKAMILYNPDILIGLPYREIIVIHLQKEPFMRVRFPLLTTILRDLAAPLLVGILWSRVVKCPGVCQKRDGFSTQLRP